MQIREQVKLTDVVGMVLFSLGVPAAVGVLSTSAADCMPHVLLLSLCRKKKQLCGLSRTEAPVETTSNDRPAQIMILYLSLRSHCAGLNFSDTEFLPT